MYQGAARQKQVPARERRQVTYYMQAFPNVREGHRFGVNRILLLEDDSLLSAGRDGVVRRWDVSSFMSPGGSTVGPRPDGKSERSEGNQPPCTGIFASHTDWVTGMAVAKGRIMASTSNDGTLKLWDLAAATRGAAGSDRADRCEDREGRRAGLGERLGGWGRDEQVGQPFEAANAHANNGSVSAVVGAEVVDCSSIASDGSRAAASRCAASTAQSPDPPPPPSPPPLRLSPLATVAGHGDYVKCLTYAPEGGVFVSGGLDKRILMWDLQRMAAPLMVLRTGDREVESDSAMTGGLSSGRPWVGEGAWFHIRDPARVVLRPGVAAAGPNDVFELCRQNKGSVYCVDAWTDATLVASGGTDRMIRLLDPRAGSGHAARVCKLDGHRDNVRCVRVDEGGTRVVSGSTDGTIRVWDVRQQYCLGVYELPGGSVWAMQPSPCDFDIYYSGGRGRRVYRTDFRTGESVLVCMTNSEVLDMALERDRESRGREQLTSMSMWLSSTEPDITFWGGHAGGGTTLRSGGILADCSSNNGIDTDTGSRCLALGKGGVGLEGGAGKCLLEHPVAVVRGQPGIVRNIVLNNRRHVLTEDDANPPNVALWDVTKARQVEAYPPGTVMKQKERSLQEIIAVRPWFTIDTHLGTPLVNLSESTVFDGELYAVDARGERQTFVEGGTVETAKSEEGSGGRESGMSGVGSDRGNGHGMIITQARSIQDEVKVNLGDAVLRGLFSKWIEQHFRLNGRIGARRQHRRSGRTGSSGSVNGEGRHADNGSAYSSGDESDSDESDQGEGWECESSLTSPVSHESSQTSARDGGVRQAGSDRIRSSHGLDVDLSGGGASGDVDGEGSREVSGGRTQRARTIRDDTTVLVTESELGGNEGMQRTLLQKRVCEFDGTEGDDVIPRWVTACVIHGKFPAREQTKVTFYLAPWVPPDPTVPSATPRQHQQNAVVRGDVSVAGRGEGSGRSVATGQQHKGERFTAPAQMPISKVMSYVLSHRKLLDRLHSPEADGREGNTGKEGEEGFMITPRESQDLVEVLCGDRVLEPHLYIGAVEQHIWSPRSMDALILHFRSPSRASSTSAV